MPRLPIIEIVNRRSLHLSSVSIWNDRQTAPMSRRLWKHNLISLDLVAWFKCKHWTGANSAEHPVLPLGWYKHDWSGRKSSCSNLNQLSPIDWGSKDNASASARAALKVNDSSHQWTFSIIYVSFGVNKRHPQQFFVSPRVCWHLWIKCLCLHVGVI